MRLCELKFRRRGVNFVPRTISEVIVQVRNQLNNYSCAAHAGRCNSNLGDMGNSHKLGETLR